MYCPHCMSKIEDGIRMCPRCGKDSTITNAENALPVGSVLSARYYVGKVLGQGGFGITYVGCDTRLDKMVAIKEYYPSGLVNRVSEHSTNLSITAGADANIYEHEKQKFIKEAHLLAEFGDDPNVVNVTDIIVEHNTAYIIMEYIKGQTLTDYLKERGKMSFKDAYDMTEPLMESLYSIHAKGLIHRDISPANIMVKKNGRVILLDFGSAREFDANDEKSMSVILKHGYAPAEQYLSRGPQGPWTDVYSLCATMYKMITGITPPSAVERMIGDVLKKPSELGAVITASQEDALIKGLSIIQTDRFSSVMDLKNAFNASDDPMPFTPPVQEKVQTVDSAKQVEKVSEEPKPQEEQKVREASKPQENSENQAVQEGYLFRKTGDDVEHLLDDDYHVLNNYHRERIEKELLERSKKLNLDLPIVLVDDFTGPDFEKWANSYMDQLYDERTTRHKNGCIQLVISVSRFKCVMKPYGAAKGLVKSGQMNQLMNDVFSTFKTDGLVEALTYYIEEIDKSVSDSLGIVELKDNSEQGGKKKSSPRKTNNKIGEKKSIITADILIAIVLVIIICALVKLWYINNGEKTTNDSLSVENRTVSGINENDSGSTEAGEGIVASTTQSGNGGSVATSSYDSQSIYDRQFVAVDLLDDQRGVLSEEDERAIEERLQDYAKEKRIDIAILLIQNGNNNNDYLVNYINEHELGKLKDGKRGYILLIDSKFGNMTMRCTRDLEQVMTDDEREALMNGFRKMYNTGSLYDALIDYIVNIEKYLDRYLEG